MNLTPRIRSLIYWIGLTALIFIVVILNIPWWGGLIIGASYGYFMAAAGFYFLPFMNRMIRRP